MSAGIELPRKVWVHGWLLAAGGERMSKSRGNFLDPTDAVATFGADGARYVTLREVPFDKDAEVSWDSFVRRYNADLANDFGNLVNRTVSMVNRYLDGERPAPRRPRLAAAVGLGVDGTRTCRSSTRYLLHEALGVAVGLRVGAANRLVDAEKPWELAKAAKAGRRGGRAERLAGVLGDLVEAVPARRARGRAVHARRSRRGCSNSSATRIRTAPTGTAARRSTAELALGRPRRRARAGSRATPPRCSRASRVEAAETTVDRPVVSTVTSQASGTDRRTRWPGSINHVEFPADDLERAKRFYTAVAGWDFQEMEGYAEYFLFGTGEGHGGAIGTRGARVGPSSSACTSRSIRRGRPRRGRGERRHRGAREPGRPRPGPLRHGPRPRGQRESASGRTPPSSDAGPGARWR